ncbi:MAG: hypothetical protein LAP86_30555 [Acidobacteriia bacterium]|nr:hypothetical protein [Terriglobia bacterium]
MTVLVLISSSLLGQERGATASVLRLISHSGIAKDADGRALTGPLGVTVALYKDEAGGAPVRLETQIVQADGNLSNANPGRRDAPKDVKIRKD